MCDIWIRIFKRAEEGGRVGRRASRITRAERLSILIARHNINVKKRAVCLVGVVADVYIQRLIADLRAGVPTECRLLPLSSRSVWSTVTLEGGRHPLTCGWYIHSCWLVCTRFCYLVRGVLTWNLESFQKISSRPRS